MSRNRKVEYLGSTDLQREAYMNAFQKNKPLIVLKALLQGVPVTLGVSRYEWSEELNSVGIECDDEGNLVHFPDGPMSLNYFLRKAAEMPDEDAVALAAGNAMRGMNKERRKRNG